MEHLTMRRLTIALGVASLAVAGAAFAQAAPADADAGHRGHHPAAPLTRADAQARADRLFDKLDVNHDGKIDAADRRLRQDQHRDARFARLDADGNGAISKAEFAAAGDNARRRFTEHAGLQDGKDGHRFGGHKFGGERVAWRGHRGHGLAMGGKKADTNHDGAITRDEFDTAALAMFDRADANHDGTVTPEERKQMHAGQRGWHRGEHPSAAG
jgi:Ca2+-binding EF-hand superfamily protein